MTNAPEALLDAATKWIGSQLRCALAPDDYAAAEAAATQRAHFHGLAAEDDRMQALRRLELSQTELAIVITLAVVELEPATFELLRSLDPRSLLGALRRFIYGEGVSRAAFCELGPTGRLGRLGMVEHVPDSDGRPTMRVSRRVLGLLLAIDAPPQEFLAQTSTRTANELATHRSTVEQIGQAVAQPGALVLVTGMPGLGRRTTMAVLATEAGRNVLGIDARRLSIDVGTLTAQLRSIALECKLLGRTPLIANIDALVDEKGERLAHVGRELGPLIEGPILVTCGLQRPTLDCGRPTIVIEMGQPTSEQRVRLWHASLGQGTIEDAQLLADQYPLAPALIVRAAEAAKARAGERPLAPDDIYGGIRAVLDDRLGQYARRVTVTQTWDDLVLPQDQVDAIIELMARVRERRTVYETWGFAAKVGKGLGVSALFSGPPGTGKTMVAALIAKDLGLELYQVDLSRIVSKYIGETEKNLGALFDAAEAGHAILLFDEADALFGKRTDVKSSNDRYANLETNYLLQRLESFTGICLLTSNHESHIDPAFQRRLSLHLRFELPEADERAQLWRATLPGAAPVAPEVDFASLGRRYAMSGGYIRNAALRAAFLAANEGVAITAAHLERAARVEYEGMGKIAA